MKENLDLALASLKKGELVIIPADTFYCIAVDAQNSTAIENLINVTGEKDGKRLTVLASEDLIYKHIKEVPEVAMQLIEVTDSPLTIIYPGATGLPSQLIMQDGSAAIRVPSNTFTKEIIRRLNRPLAVLAVRGSSPEVSYTAPVTFEEILTGKDESVIKLGIGGEVKIIRK